LRSAVTHANNLLCQQADTAGLHPRAYLRREVIEPVADATVAAGLAKPIEQ